MITMSQWHSTLVEYLHQINFCVRCYLVTNYYTQLVVDIIVLLESVKRTQLSDLCYDHSVNSAGLFLFLFVHGPKMSTALERIAQIYLPYLPFFASLSQKGWFFATPSPHVKTCLCKISECIFRQTSFICYMRSVMIFETKIIF